MKLLTTQDNKYLLWVDPEAEVKEGDFYKYNYPQYVTVFRANEGIKNALQKELVKIIAHLPLTPDAAPLEGVPLLPPLSVQGYPEQEPMDYYPPKDLANAIWGNCFDYKNVDTEYEGEAIKNRVRGACFAAERYFYFQAASQDRKYSEEDIRRAVEKGVEIGFNNTQCNYHTIGEPTLHHIGVHNGIEEYIQSLSPAASLPVAFEPEYMYSDGGPIWFDKVKHPGTMIAVAHKTITLPNGQQQLVGRYKYKEDNHA